MKTQPLVLSLLLAALVYDAKAATNYTVYATTGSVATAVAAETPVPTWNWIYMRVAGDDCYVMFNGTATAATNTPISAMNSTFSFQKTDLWSGYITFLPVHSNATVHVWGSK